MMMMIILYFVIALILSEKAEAAFHLRSRSLVPFSHFVSTQRTISISKPSLHTAPSHSVHWSQRTLASKSTTSIYYRNDKAVEDASVDLDEYDRTLLNVPFFVSSGVDDAIAKLKVERTRPMKPEDTESSPVAVAESESETLVVEDIMNPMASTNEIQQVPTMQPPRRALRSYKQRMSVFEGGEPFFSLSNIEYGVSSERIANAAMTGAALSAGTLLSTVISTTMDPYSPTASILDMDLAASSWLLAVPIVSAYLSITRCTIGGLTRTVSDSVMNFLRLGHLLGSSIASIPVDTFQAIATAEDSMGATVSSTIDEKSIPTLCGELVWYNSMAVVQRAAQSLRRTEQTVQQAVDHVVQQQVERTRRERLQRQERKQRALLQAQLYYARKPQRLPPLSATVLKEEASVAANEGDSDDPTFPPTVLSKNDLAISARRKEAAQRLLLQRQIELRSRSAAVVSSAPLFYLGEEERNVAAFLLVSEELPIAPPHKHLFLLGDEEREVVSPTIDVMEPVSLKTDLALEATPNMAELTEAGDFLLPPNDRVFYLGEDEREHMRMENASLPEPFLDESIPDEDDVLMQSHSTILPSEVVPVQHVFLLGFEERDAVQTQYVSTTAPFLLGVDIVPAVNAEESVTSLSEPVFLLGDEEREVLKTVTDPIVPSIALNDSRDVEKEKRAIAEARRLIQKRAIELVKKRLAEVLSGVRWKKNLVHELKHQNSVVATHSMSDICSERLARRSHRIQQFIARNRRYGTLFTDKSLVERGAMYLLAVTTPILVNCWIQQAVTEYAFDDADAAN
jgi:hypothetical protein